MRRARGLAVAAALLLVGATLATLGDAGVLRARPRHERGPTYLRFALDGETLASFAPGGELVLWDATPLLVPHAGFRSVRARIALPGRRSLALDGQLRAAILGGPSGAEITSSIAGDERARASSVPVTDVACSDDGTRVAWRERSSWFTWTGRLEPLPDVLVRFDAAAILEDGSVLALGGYEREARAVGRVAPGGAVTLGATYDAAPAISRDGTALAVGDDEATLTFSALDRSRRLTLAIPAGATAFAGTADRLVVLERSGRAVHVVDLTDGRRHEIPLGARGTGIAVTPEGGLLAVGLEDGTVEAYALR